jgi:gamma-glutamyltranspeptidase/glutathione hydrolase
MSAQDAVDAPRFHHQLLPKNQIRHYSGFDKKTLEELQKMGYITKESGFGDLQIITNRNNKLNAASQSGKRHRGVSLTFD